MNRKPATIPGMASSKMIAEMLKESADAAAQSLFAQLQRQHERQAMSGIPRLERGPKGTLQVVVTFPDSTERVVSHSATQLVRRHQLQPA